MRILFVCHRFPFPPNRGGKIRPFQMIRHLAQNHEVTVATLAHSAQEVELGAGLREHCSAILVEVLPDSQRWPQAALALPFATPSSVAYFSSKRLHARVRDAWERQPFDAAIVHCAFMAPYVLPLHNALRLMDFGDLDSGKWADYSTFRAFPLSLGYGIEARKLRRFETQVARTFDASSVTTNGELQEFLSFGTQKPCTVIPNGVDGDYFRHRSPSTPRKPVIAFLGRMDYFPNIDGLCNFAAQVFPRIRARIPDARLRIIGSNPSERVRRLASLPGIEVTGHVPDVRPFVDDASVAIAPLRIARGTQNKVLECMAMGVPVVASSHAAKGIQAEAGRHLLVADQPESFAAHVLRLMEDPALADQISQLASEHVREQHKWTNSMKILDRVLEENLSRFRSRAVS